jgi:hypothetical protein
MQSCGALLVRLDVFTVVTVKNAVLWSTACKIRCFHGSNSEEFCRVTLVRKDSSEGYMASFFRVKDS